GADSCKRFSNGAFVGGGRSGAAFCERDADQGSAPGRRPRSGEEQDRVDYSATSARFVFGRDCDRPWRARAALGDSEAVSAEFDRVAATESGRDEPNLAGC